jgi:hypothetical protein
MSKCKLKFFTQVRSFFHFYSLTFFCLILFLSLVKSETKKQIDPELEKLKTILSKHQKVTVQGGTHLDINTGEKDCFNCETGGYGTIWDGKNMMLWKNGTGKIYAYDKGIERLDNTCYQGGTFGAIVVKYKDTLFSVGGYGFWTINGALRYYNTNTREWFIQAVNKEVRVATGVNAIYQFDKNKGILYVIYTTYGNEYHTENEKTERIIHVQALDLNTKKWWDQPRVLNPEIASSIREISYSTSFHDGLLIQSVKNSFLFLNFSSNKILKLFENKIVEIVQKKDKIFPTHTFTSTEGIHYYNIKIDSLITVKLNKTDFEKSQIPLYVSKQNNTKFGTGYIDNPMIWLLIVLTVVSFYYANHMKNKNNKLIQKTNNQLDTNNYYGFINSLLPIELSLLTSILKSNLEKSKTPAESLNKILGLENKPLKIQNNQRAEAIAVINKKFKIKISPEENIIERDRVESDKRFFEYSINSNYIQELECRLDNI